ncbi:hypothetical protein [Roseivirga sp.]|uniref:hypothetical protein n=1 Tax=Roseivirga sp. TaxID=1964215 RepID=UPI003B8BF6A1
MSKKKINWLSLFLEFFVVLVGILIAFQLTEYAESKRREQNLETHFNDIFKETEYNQRNFSYAKSIADWNLKKIDSTLTLILEKGDLNEINRLSHDILNYGGLYIRQNAYTSLVESGDMKYFKRFEERKAVVDLYEYYVWVQLIESLSSNSFSEDIIPYFKANFDLVNQTVQPRSSYDNKQYLNALATYRMSIAQKITKYADCEKIIAGFIKFYNER